MKHTFALSAIILATLIGVTACERPNSNVSDEASSKSAESAGSDASDASLYLQTLFTAIQDGNADANTNAEDMGCDQLTKTYFQAMNSLDEDALGEVNVKKLITEYSKNVESFPEGSYISLDPKTLEVLDDGTVKITGEDLFVIVKDGGKISTHKGASLDSDESLDDVFILSKAKLGWKVTDVTL